MNAIWPKIHLSSFKVCSLWSLAKTGRLNFNLAKRNRGVLEPSLVAVEQQLRSDPLFRFTQGQSNSIQYQVDRLLCASLVGNDAVIIKTPNHGQVL